jgi:hypothetical protein
VTSLMVKAPACGHALVDPSSAWVAPAEGARVLAHLDPQDTPGSARRALTDRTNYQATLRPGTTAALTVKTADAWLPDRPCRSSPDREPLRPRYLAGARRLQNAPATHHDNGPDSRHF